MATEYLDLDDAFDAYAEAVEVSVDQARFAVLNLAQLESTLARPRNAAAYEGADIARQAATLFWGVAANHAFRDGNKRTAVVLLRSFLNLNGFDMTLTEVRPWSACKRGPLPKSGLRRRSASLWPHLCVRPRLFSVSSLSPAGGNAEN